MAPRSGRLTVSIVACHLTLSRAGQKMDRMTEEPRAEAAGRHALLAAARAELVEHGHAAISLRAVARRAGLSHAAPKYHFRDRAGLLTAVAADGFRLLTAELEPASSLADLGRAYIDFGLAHPALFDLMFRPSELHPDDPDLTAAQQRSVDRLSEVVTELGHASPLAGAGQGSPPAAALMSWAFVHGLVVLTRDGAMTAATRAVAPQQAVSLVHALTDIFNDAVAASPSSSAGS